MTENELNRLQNALTYSQKIYFEQFKLFHERMESAKKNSNKQQW